MSHCLSRLLCFVSFNFCILFAQVDYHTQIQPIFNSNCGNCHIGSSSGGLNLSSYANLMAGGNSGAVIIPGNHAGSLLWQRVNNGSMPPAGNLSATQINLIANWIDEGALEFPAYSGPVWYVSVSGSDENDGSEDSPFATIQAGLNAAGENDTVFVGPGTYAENIYWPATNGIDLIGSNVNDCIIDGNSQGSVIQIGDILNPDLNFVVDSTTVIQGFTLQNGNGFSNSGNSGGGGINCHKSGITLRNLMIVNNYGSFGGGLYFYESESRLTYLTISENSAAAGGGGIFAKVNCDLLLSSSAINENTCQTTAGGAPGGMYIGNNSNAELSNVSIIGNNRNGMQLYTTNSLLENVTVTQNEEDGIFIQDCDSTSITELDVYENNRYGINIQSSHVEINSGEIFGQKHRGIYSYESTLSISNTVIHGNSVSQDTTLPDYYTGGGIHAHNSTMELVHVTLANNTSNEGENMVSSGGIKNQGSNITILNSICWGNSDEQIGDGATTGGSVSVQYSNIQDGWGGEGNIDSPPLFCNPEDHEYTLAENSPCIGSGQDGANMGALDVGCDPILSIRANELPEQFIVYQNYPNPFNPSTTLSYDLPKDGLIKITIYDMMGRVVKTLANVRQSAGRKTLEWHGRNNAGEPVSAGLYLVTIDAGTFRQSIKVVLLK